MTTIESADHQADTLRQIMAEQMPDRPIVTVRPQRLAGFAAAVALLCDHVRRLRKPVPHLTPPPPMTFEERAARDRYMAKLSDQIQRQNIRENLNAYQRRAMETAVYPRSATVAGQGLAYTTLGLCGEAGELANGVKKIMRGDRSADDCRELLVADASDVLWYLAAVATELGVGLGDVALANLDKLSGRTDRGTIRGDGDDR